MAIVYAAKGLPVIQYDGTNSADVVTAFETVNAALEMEASIVSEIAGVLVIEGTYSTSGPAGPFTLNTDDWLNMREGDVIPDAVFQSQWIPVA